MADHHRIQPVHNDVEAPAKPTTSSDKDAPPAPATPSRPTLGPPNNKKRSYNSYKSILLWTTYALILLLVTISAILGIMFLALRPKLPRFSVHGVRMTRFDLGSNDTVSATFSARITCVNPNERIGVLYGGGGHVSAWYGGAKLSEASLPELYQGHRNTTVVRMKMSGRSNNATALVTSLGEAGAMVLVDLRVDLPVRVKVGVLTLPEVKLLARCKLEVDKERAPIIKIRNSGCKFGFRF